jgi:hypothetical protein
MWSIMRVSGALLLALAAAARADTAAGGVVVVPPSPSWINHCAAIFERAIPGGSFTHQWIEEKVQAPWECQLPKPYHRVVFDHREQGVHVVIDVGTPITGRGPSEATWIETPSQGRALRRTELGRLAAIHMKRAEPPSVRDVRLAADACLNAAPTFSLPPEWRENPAWRESCELGFGPQPERVAVCVEALRALGDIENMCVYESRQVSDAATPGRTFTAVSAIVRLGPHATPLLVGLAHSKNPVSRMAAITGFRLLPSEIGRKELRRLSSDKETAMTQFGCLGLYKPVSELITEPLL